MIYTRLILYNCPTILTARSAPIKLSASAINTPLCCSNLGQPFNSTCTPKGVKFREVASREYRLVETEEFTTYHIIAIFDLSFIFT